MASKPIPNSSTLYKAEQSTDAKLPIVVLFALLILLVARFLIGSFYELTPDETQYFMWSERLNWSYYSKGPGVALFIKASTTLFGNNEFAIRFFAPVLSFSSSILVFIFTKKLTNTKLAIIYTFLLNLTPIFNVGSILMTIDPISIFFWIATLLTCWQAITCKDKNSSFLYFALTGICIGFGFLAKYTNAIQLISIVILFAIYQKKFQLRFTGLILCFIAFLICTLPVIIWNSKNNWITVTHLSDHTKGTPESVINFNSFFSYFASHLGVYSPLIFLLICFVLIISLLQIFNPRCTTRFNKVFFLTFSLPLICMYFLLSFKSSCEANWTAPGFVSAGFLLPIYFKEKFSRAMKKFLAVAMVISAIMSLLISNTNLIRLFNVNLGLLGTKNIKYLNDLPRKENPDFFARIGDPTNRMRGWQKSSQYLDKLIENFAEKEKIFLIAKRYQIATALGFYLKNNEKIIIPNKHFPKVNIIGSPKIQNQFSLWQNYFNSPDEFLGKNALYIDDHHSSRNPPKSLKKQFKKIVPLSFFLIYIDKNISKYFRIYACYEYRNRK